MGWEVLAIVLVALTGPDGHQRIYVNPSEVTSIREGTVEGKLMVAGTHCVIVTTSGKFIAVHEDCDTVRMRLEPGQGRPCTLVCGGERP